MDKELPHNLGATNNSALASLILAIAFVILGPLGSIPAIVLGNQALKGYAAAGVSEGRGMAKTGVIIGWVGLILFVLSIVVGLVALDQLGRIANQIQDLNAE